MTSASRIGSSFEPARRLLISSLKSSMFFFPIYCLGAPPSVPAVFLKGLSRQKGLRSQASRNLFIPNTTQSLDLLSSSDAPEKHRPQTRPEPGKLRPRRKTVGRAD